MIWLILAIIIAAILIANAVNKQSETNARIAVYNGLSDEEKAAYNQQQANVQRQIQYQAMLRKRTELYKHILQLRREGKKEPSVAANSKVQTLAPQAGLEITDAYTLKALMCTEEFLTATNLMVPFNNMVGEGLDDDMIAKKLGSGWNSETSKYTWFKPYKPEDIAVIRNNIRAASAPAQPLSSSWSRFNEAVDSLPKK